MKQGSGEDCMMRSFMISIVAKYYLGDQFKKNDISGSCATLEERRGWET
jgi:hypothetical protein